MELVRNMQKKINPSTVATAYTKQRCGLSRSGNSKHEHESESTQCRSISFDPSQKCHWWEIHRGTSTRANAKYHSDAWRIHEAIQLSNKATAYSHHPEKAPQLFGTKAVHPLFATSYLCCIVPLTGQDTLVGKRPLVFFLNKINKKINEAYEPVHSSVWGFIHSSLQYMHFYALQWVWFYVKKHTNLSFFLFLIRCLHPLALFGLVDF